MPKSQSSDLDNQTKERWWRFANEYVKTYNGGKAYVECGAYKVNHRSSADSNACKLLKNPIVQQFIKEAEEKLKTELHLSQKDVVTEQLRIAMSDMKNYVRWGQNGIEWIPSDELSEDMSRAVEQVEIWEETTETDRRSSTRRRMKIKLHSKTTSLEMLAKHLGMYRETVDVNHTFGVIEVPAMSLPDDWASVVEQQVEHINGSNGRAATNSVESE